MEFLFVILSVLIWVIIVGVWVRMASGVKKRRQTIAADGHVIPPEKDITCEGREGHIHPKRSAAEEKEYGPRYIVHDDPEIGYVVLNGVKRKISDCKDL